MSTDRHSIAVDTRLRDCKDRQVSFRWELAIDQRLDDLVRRALDAGERTNRRELLAALVLAADHDGTALGELLRAYRIATVADAMLQPPSESTEDNVVEFRTHRPGPRVSDA